MTRGRKTKLTPLLQKTICDAICAGNYAETSAAYAGIVKSTYYHWLERGKSAKSGIYKDFSDAIKKAEADAEAGRVMTVFSAAMGGQQIANKRITKTTTKPDGSVVEESRNEVSFTPPIWTAAAWWLERKFPERWGRKDALTVKTWQDEVIDLLKDGKLEIDDVIAELGHEQGSRLAIAAGIHLVQDRADEGAGIGAEETTAYQ